MAWLISISHVIYIVTCAKDWQAFNTERKSTMRRTYYIYKGFDRQNPIAIIAPNVNKERHVAEIKRLAKENGHITIRNSLGGLMSEVREDGKIVSFIY
jgi:hypothetical protein